MMLSSLAGRCGGEENGVSVCREAVDECRSAGAREVLSHLEALDQVEAPSKVESLSEIVRSEAIGRNLQPFEVHPRPIDAEDVLDSLRAPGAKPCAIGAPNIENAGYYTDDLFIGYANP